MCKSANDSTNEIKRNTHFSTAYMLRLPKRLTLLFYNKKEINENKKCRPKTKMLLDKKKPSKIESLVCNIIFKS